MVLDDPVLVSSWPLISFVSPTAVPEASTQNIFFCRTLVKKKKKTCFFYSDGATSGKVGSSAQLSQ